MLGFRIDDADGDGVEMRPHSVHAEPNESNLLATPVESCVGMPLLLAAAVDGASHVAE